MASVGHIRGLPKKSMGINLSNYEATYEITNSKVVSELKKEFNDLGQARKKHAEDKLRYYRGEA